MGEFSKFSEENIIALVLENTDFFNRVIQFLEPKYFVSDECVYIMNAIHEYYRKYDVAPSKEVLAEIINKELNADSTLVEPVLKTLNATIDIRTAPYIKDQIISWAKKKQIAMLYDDEVVEKARSGDMTKIYQIIEDAAKITDVVIKPFDFFNEFECLFVVNEKDCCTTGFPRLDVNFNDKGPARGEVFLWVAPTGVGKSIMLVNTGAANLLRGKKVLHISLENSKEVTAARYMGCFTNEVIKTRFSKKEVIEQKLRKIKEMHDNNLKILYFPTDSVSINEIDLAMKELERHHGFKPDILIIDYLECLLSRRPDSNKDDYKRQKAVSSELRALSSQKNVNLFSASQTNRAGSNAADEGQNINLDKLAESFGKSMPVDYVVSINQSQNEYRGQSGNPQQETASHIGRVRLFIAKNRNGPKFITINAEINYATMKANEEG